jgi:chorismate dehydratase
MNTDDKIRVSCVSFMNSLPFIYGLEHHSVINSIILHRDTPSVCADKLSRNEVDIGLVPVAVIPLIPDAQICSPFCISADDEVKSVVLLSEVPLNEIEEVYLDYQSVTSVNLTRILMDRFWKLAPVFIQGIPGYENKIEGKRAGLVIGDRALKLRSKFPFVTDLAHEWKKYTGLPFVFACWVANRSLSKFFLSDFNEALELGLKSIPEMVKEFDRQQTAVFQLETYLTKNLNYRLDDKRKESMKLFLNYIESLNPIANIKLPE